MRQFLMGTAIALAMTGAAFAQDVGGNYTVEGTSFDGGHYGGTARIVITSNTTCEIYWTTSGGQESSGICMRNQNAFSAAYALGSVIGLVIYEIKPDGVLDGLWTVAGQEGIGSEVLTPQ